jgi:hypothetical protein
MILIFRTFKLQIAKNVKTIVIVIHSSYKYYVKSRIVFFLFYRMVFKIRRT